MSSGLNPKPPVAAGFVTSLSKRAKAVLNFSCNLVFHGGVDTTTWSVVNEFNDAMTAAFFFGLVGSCLVKTRCWRFFVVWEKEKSQSNKEGQMSCALGGGENY